MMIVEYGRKKTRLRGRQGLYQEIEYDERN